MVAELYELTAAFEAAVNESKKAMMAGSQPKQRVLDPTPIMTALTEHGFPQGVLTSLALQLSSTLLAACARMTRRCTFATVRNSVVSTG